MTFLGLKTTYPVVQVFSPLYFLETHAIAMLFWPTVCWRHAIGRFNCDLNKFYLVSEFAHFLQP